MIKNDVKYIIRLNDREIDRDDLGYMFRRASCNKLFCATLINISCSHFYFELGDNKDLVIIPHRWVDWMAPVKDTFKEGEINGKVSRC